MDGIWKMLNQTEERPKEYVLSSNETFTVKDLINISFNKAGIYGRWEGEKLDEIYIDNLTNKTLVAIDAKFYRPADVESLLGCSDLARKELGWKPEYTFDMLISEMVENDIKLQESKYP